MSPADTFAAVKQATTAHLIAELRARFKHAAEYGPYPQRPAASHGETIFEHAATEARLAEIYCSTSHDARGHLDPAEYFPPVAIHPEALAAIPTNEITMIYKGQLLIIDDPLPRWSGKHQSAG